MRVVVGPCPAACAPHEVGELADWARLPSGAELYGVLERVVGHGTWADGEQLEQAARGGVAVEQREDVRVGRVQEHQECHALVQRHCGLPLLVEADGGPDWVRVVEDVVVEVGARVEAAAIGHAHSAAVVGHVLVLLHIGDLLLAPGPPVPAGEEHGHDHPLQRPVAGGADEVAAVWALVVAAVFAHRVLVLALHGTCRKRQHFFQDERERLRETERELGGGGLPRTPWLPMARSRECTQARWWAG